jgi:type VI secretion system Hcp family effector
VLVRDSYVECVLRAKATVGEGRKLVGKPGDVTLRGREGAVALISVTHEIDTPYHAATGHMSGKRQHKPISVVALISGTPKLYGALIGSEVPTSVKIEF